MMPCEYTVNMILKLLSNYIILKTINIKFFSLLYIDNIKVILLFK